jgi:acetyl esterase/lipase
MSGATIAAEDAFQAYRDLLAQAATDPGIEGLRAAYEDFFARVSPPSGGTATELTIGGVPCLRAVADDARIARTVVLVHGGAYLCGSARGSSGLAIRLSKAMEAEVIAPDYRLAPEHPFPAPIEDVVGVVRELVGQGRAPGSIVLVGDSAGGGIVVSVALRLRHEAGGDVGAIVCFSPWVDLELLGRTMESKAEADPVGSAMALGMSVGLYLGDADPASPEANPLHADLRGLPPMLLQSGSEEVLLDDSVRLARHAGEAGVDVTLHVQPGLPHVYQYFAALPAAQDAIERAGEFARRTVIDAG